MLKSPYFLDLKGQNKRFWESHGESENCSLAIIGSNFRAPGPKNLLVITRCKMLLRVKIKNINR